MGKQFKPVIYIVGPTASGKTALSVQLARYFGGEIVCADSMQIYRGMPIATAAPTAEEKGEIPHYLFEFLDRTESYSVSRYMADAKAAIAQIQSRGRLPFVVGGTGLYAQSLAENINFGTEAQNPAVRRRLNEFALQNGNAALYQRLVECDPVAAEKISPNDRKRTVRALEVFEITGERISERAARARVDGPIYNNLWIGTFFADRQLLYHRIEQRVDQMLFNGLLQETRQICETAGQTSSQAIGHKELIAYLSGEKTLEEAVAHLKQQTRRYAKRQITWFSRNAQLHRIFMDTSPSPVEEAKRLIQNFLKEGGG